MVNKRSPNVAGCTQRRRARLRLSRSFGRQCRRGGWPTGEEVLAQIDTGTPADTAAAARHPLLGLAAACAMQVSQELNVGFAFAVGCQRARETPGIDEVKAVSRQTGISRAAE